jgi:hypothetical protein
VILGDTQNRLTTNLTRIWEIEGKKKQVKNKTEENKKKRTFRKETKLNLGGKQPIEELLVTRWFCG